MKRRFMAPMIMGIGFCVLGFLNSCTEKDTTFLIADEKVGKLDKISLVRDLELIYEGDSVVKGSALPQMNNRSKKIKVYEKGGKLLLTLTPTTDSIPSIENIAVEDSRFQTDGGIGLNSTFKDILGAYEIKKVVTTMSSLVVFPKESNLYFTIDKAELPENLRYGNGNIDAVQIPDGAKIKYLMVGWDY